MTISLEQAEKMLFEEEATKTEEEPERLLKKMVPQDGGELETIPYYKKPLVQIIAVIAFSVPILWGIVSAFSPPTPDANSQGEESTEDKQEQLYKESLEEERGALKNSW